MKLDSSSFLAAAAGAFPPSCCALAQEAALALSAFVEPDYGVGSTRVIVRGHKVQIPRRLHFRKKRMEKLYALPALEPIVQCLLTRSTDGFERHAALRRLLTLNECWSIPFVILLAGEYVVEIIHDIVSSISLLDPAAYAAFVRENTQLMTLLRARATSYWNCYYRDRFADLNQYPGLVFLHQLERWSR